MEVEGLGHLVSAALSNTGLLLKCSLTDDPLSCHVQVQVKLAVLVGGREEIVGVGGGGNLESPLVEDAVVFRTWGRNGSSRLFTSPESADFPGQLPVPGEPGFPLNAGGLSACWLPSLCIQ